MRNTLRNIVIAGAVALSSAAGLTAAKADVIRIAIVAAGSQADYDSNLPFTDTFKDLLKKGKGVKAVYVA